MDKEGFNSVKGNMDTEGSCGAIERFYSGFSFDSLVRSLNLL
jgi:hypothetical protein